jgi:hypothetical protein
MRRLEIAVNVSIVAVCAVLCFVLVRERVLPRSPRQVDGEVSVGSRVSLNGLSSSNSAALLLVVSPTCHFCVESADFYRRLLTALQGSPVRVTALLLNRTDEAPEYLKRLPVPVTHVPGGVRQLRVRGTPTILLVDRNGIVQNVWVGKLPIEKENEVIATAVAAATN